MLVRGEGFRAIQRRRRPALCLPSHPRIELGAQRGMQPAGQPPFGITLAQRQQQRLRRRILDGPQPLRPIQQPGARP